MTKLRNEKYGGGGLRECHENVRPENGFFKNAFESKMTIIYNFSIETHGHFLWEHFPLAAPRKFLERKLAKNTQIHFFQGLVTLWDLIIQPPQVFSLEPHGSGEQVSYW